MIINNSIENENPEFGGAILAGGAASRYDGAAKGLLHAGKNRCIIAHLIDEMMACKLTDISIVANEHAPYARFGVDIIPDQRQGIGPLAGIEAALAHFQNRRHAVMILPCDMPEITRVEMETLLASFPASASRLTVARTEEKFWQPLCMVAAVDLLEEVSKAITDGVRSAGRLCKLLGAAPVDFCTGERFVNINTPEEMENFRIANDQGT